MNQELTNTNHHKKIDFKTKVLFQIFFSYLFSFFIGIAILYLLNMAQVPKETLFESSSYLNALYFFGIILVQTAIIIFLIKFFKKINFLKIIDIFVTFFAIFGILSFFISNLIVLIILTILLVLIKEYWKNKWYRNFIIFLISGFFSAYFAYTLGIIPIMVLLILIAIYDFIAVFKTKHMIFLANNIIGKNTLFVMTYGKDLPIQENNSKDFSKIQTETKKELRKDSLNLGTGDFVLPLIGVMALFAINPLLGIIGFLAVLFGLELTIWLLFNKKHLALPAIPLQVVSLLIIYGVYLLINCFI
jgi:presenilin-like A22 family membrane protease